MTNKITEEDLILGNCEEIESLFKAEPPLSENKNGFGFYGVILRNKITDKIQCHICGEWFSSLISHFRKHKINNMDYRKKFGLPLHFPLVSKGMSKRKSEFQSHRKKYYWEKALKIRMNVNEKNKTWKKQYKAKMKYARTCAAFQNKIGSCEEQILKRYLVLSELIGKIPSQRELEKNDMPLKAIIQRRYGNINNFRKKHGIDIEHSIPRKFSEENLIGWLKKAQIKLGRTPRGYDFGNNIAAGRFDQNAPYYQSFCNKFGSFRRSLAKAGII